MASSIGAVLLTSATSFASGWTEVPGPASPKNPGIYGLASMSSSDTWAVGSSGSQGGKTLIERWDGTSWNVVPNPVSLGQLRAVTALSSADAWSVGFRDNVSARLTLVEHWDGTRWVEVPSPSIGTYDQLVGVSAVSSNDVWAVGYSISPNNAYILMHWNGTAWSLVEGPPVRDGVLSGVKALASEDIWAVGYKDYNANNNTASTFTLHWDGTVWSEIPSPNVDASNFLAAVDGTAPDDLWAVGNSGGGATIAFFHTLALHWDGTAWTVVPTPVITNSDAFTAVKVLSPRNVLAVGYSLSVGPLTQRWNGRQWRNISTPSGEEGALLFAISDSGGTTWAAGYQYLSFPDTDELFLQSTRGAKTDAAGEVNIRRK
ncbi:MAG: hypothetical protein H0X34_15760 [Chthoniobacterales bacterium]|nr:hypothetical protein [Chthoniobacterales bacterium]